MFDKKSERKLSYIWKTLLNFKNYQIPETIEDLKDVVIWGSKITIDSHECYLTEKAKRSLREFVDIIYSVPEMCNTLTYNTIYQETLKEIECDIQRKIHKNDVREFVQVKNNLIQKLNESKFDYQFFFEVEGIEFQGFTNLNLGSIEFFIFNEEKKKLVVKERNEKGVNKDFNSNISEFIDRNFLNKLCISCWAFGDFAKAEQLAKIKVRELLNFIRFLVCIHAYDRIPRNIIKINILAEAYAGNDKQLAIRKTDGAAILSGGRGRRPLQNLPITEKYIQWWREDVFLEGIIQILNSHERNEVEGIIITAIYWTGEAQNEFDREIAFLKYWTALECIFSHNKEEITHSLAKGVSILITFGGYKFSELEEIENVYKKISRLYSLRSKIVHQGMLDCVSELQLVDLCKYTSWTILSLLYLRSIGYVTMDEIDKETTRLYTSVKTT